MSTPQTTAPPTRPLSREEVQQGIGSLDLSAQGSVRRAAEAMSQGLAGDGRDLLHDAICKALTSRTCKADLTVEAFLNGVMRSIASTRRRSRERGKGNHIFLPADEVAERIGNGGYQVVSAEQLIEIERVRSLCADVLERLSSASPAQAALIDAIGLDLRGRELAEHLGVTPGELATLRRGLKRHVQRLWPDIEAALESGRSAAS